MKDFRGNLSGKKVFSNFVKENFSHFAQIL